jgi:hypothetical protein
MVVDLRVFSAKKKKQTERLCLERCMSPTSAFWIIRGFETARRAWSDGRVEVDDESMERFSFYKAGSLQESKPSERYI